MMIRVGLYGMNGHQVHRQLVNHPHAKLTAFAGFDRAELPPELAADLSITTHRTFADLLADPAVDIIALCSPRRADQAGHAIAAMEAGKHVLAEKPCAMSVAELDQLISTTKRTGRRFHEMGGTAFEQPALTIRESVSRGELGTVVQIIANKSYPYHENRPQDEAIDGGLTLQCAVHAARFVEHVSHQRVTHVSAFETGLGNPVTGGGLIMGSCIAMRLSNGAVATANSNYLNPTGSGSWGNDGLQIFGTKGMAEFRLVDKSARITIGSTPTRAIAVSAPSRNYFDALIDSLITGKPMPLNLEDELHPTRVVLQAKQSIARGGAVVAVD